MFNLRRDVQSTCINKNPEQLTDTMTSQLMSSFAPCQLLLSSVARWFSRLPNIVSELKNVGLECLVYVFERLIRNPTRAGGSMSGAAGEGTFEFAQGDINLYVYYKVGLIGDVFMCGPH